MWLVSATHLHTLYDGHSAGVQGSGPPFDLAVSTHSLASGRKMKDKKTLLQAIFIGEKSILTGERLPLGPTVRWMYRLGEGWRQGQWYCSGCMGVQKHLIISQLCLLLEDHPVHALRS